MSSAKKRISVLVATLVMMIVLCVGATTVLAATPAGAITSVSNTSSGVKISWKKDSSKSGYYIYRKSTSSLARKRNSIPFLEVCQRVEKDK